MKGKQGEQVEMKSKKADQKVLEMDNAKIISKKAITYYQRNIQREESACSTGFEYLIQWKH